MPPGVLLRAGVPVHVDAFCSIRIVPRLCLAFASGHARACRCLLLHLTCPSIVASALWRSWAFVRERAPPCTSMPCARFVGVRSRAGAPVHLDALCSITRMWVVHPCSLLPRASWSFAWMRVMHLGAPGRAFARGRARACRCLWLDSNCPSVVDCFRERAHPCMSMPFARFELSLGCGLLSCAGRPLHVVAFCSIRIVPRLWLVRSVDPGHSFASGHARAPGCLVLDLWACVRERARPCTSMPLLDPSNVGCALVQLAALC